MNLATEKQTLKSTFASAQGAEAQRLALEIRDNVVLMAETPRIYLVCTNPKVEIQYRTGSIQYSFSVSYYIIKRPSICLSHDSWCKSYRRGQSYRCCFKVYNILQLQGAYILVTSAEFIVMVDIVFDENRNLLHTTSSIYYL